ncbi:MAG: hypothetical protein RLZZ621_1560, partial [Gemmatimonadota bacterium]
MRRLFASLRFARVALGCLAAAAAPCQSQSPPPTLRQATLWSVAPSGVPMTTNAERVFDVSAELRSSTVYDMSFDAQGIPWIGTEEGLYRYTGSQWRREALPEIVPQQTVRALLWARDGSLWGATRRGIFRRAPNGQTQFYDEQAGVVGGLAYSLIETRAIDGTWRIVAGLYDGPAYFDGTRFVLMKIPDAPPPRGVMVAETIGPDGTAALWSADAVGGVARFERGRWRTFGPRDGLDIDGAQAFTVSTTPGTAPLYVAGVRGVYAYTREGAVERFVRVPGSPQGAIRAAVVPTGARDHELWVGTGEGQLLRYRDGQWSEVPTRVAQRRGAVLLLRTVEGHGQGVSVYMSTRSGYLGRLQVGTALSIPSLPTDASRLTAALFAERAADGHDALWLIGDTRTVVYVHSDGRTTRYPVEASPDNRSMVFPSQIGRFPAVPPRRRSASMPRSATDGVMLAVQGGVPRRLTGRQFATIADGLAGARVQQMLRAELPDGTDRLVAATTRGLFFWTGSAWVRDATATRTLGDSVFVSAVATGREAGERVLYLGTPRGVLVQTATGTRLEPMPVATPTMRELRVLRLCSQGDGSVGSHVFALAQDRGVFWRPAGARAWQPLPTRLRRSMSDASGVDLLCLEKGRVLVATPTGLSLLETAADTAGWQVRAQVTDADGLPGSTINRAATSGTAGFVWVGTAFGIGLADLERAKQRIPPTLVVRVSSQAGLRSILPDSVVPAGDDDIEVDAALLTYHREEATRFKVRFRAESWREENAASGSDDSPPDEREWLASSTRNFLDLAPGRYVLAVWAYDWTGREYGPVVQRFTVLASVWRRWPALALYLIFASSLGGLAYRWRRRTLAEAERERRDTERQVAAERVHYEEQIREAQKLESLGTLAGGVAHDFNNLLGVIRGNAELARTALRKGRSGEDQLGAILDASDRARDIVRQILTFSRRSSPTRDFVNLPLLVRDLQPLLRRMVPRSVQLAFEGLDGVHVIRGDTTQLQQLLLNLVSNAEHAIRGRDRQVITITLGARTVASEAPVPNGDVVVLRVSDTGAGMSPEVRSRVFEPFFTTKPTGEGTGLGMAVVHGIVVSHGARAEVMSDVGAGTTFEILFPRVAVSTLFDEGLDPSMIDEVEPRVTPPMAIPAISSDGMAPSGGTLVVAGVAPETVRTPDGGVAVADDLPDRGGASILVVDDELAVAQVVAQALAQAGHAVQIFTKPEEALAAVRHASTAVDLLITDQTMPGLTGDQLAEAVHVLRPNV